MEALTLSPTNDTHDAHDTIIDTTNTPMKTHKKGFIPSPTNQVIPLAQLDASPSRPGIRLASSPLRHLDTENISTPTKKPLLKPLVSTIAGGELDESVSPIKMPSAVIDSGYGMMEAQRSSKISFGTEAAGSPTRGKRIRMPTPWPKAAAQGSPTLQQDADSGSGGSSDDEELEAIVPSAGMSATAA